MRIFTLLVMLMTAQSTATFAQQRIIEVPAAARWQHARSQVILPVAIDGLPRSQIIENVAPELDVTVHYEDADTRISIFLYRPALPDVAIWFDRSEMTFMANPMFGTVTPVGQAVAFAAPGTTIASGLRRSYVGTGDYPATATAIFPTGRWFVKVRASSKSADTATLEARLSAAISALERLASPQPFRPAEAMQACTGNRNWRDAEMADPDSIGAIVAYTGAMTIATDSQRRLGQTDPSQPPQRYCRDATVHQEFGVYRIAGNTQAYVMAVGDGGAIIEVGSALLRRIARDSFAGDLAVPVTVSSGNTIAGYPPFKRLPSPQQVFALTLNGEPIATGCVDPDRHIPPEPRDGSRPRQSGTCP